jgi:glutamate/tyrosine decarboxylase-like PLP-dependent enzyme
MVLDAMQEEYARVERLIADGPILPRVTAEEIRSYLTTRYNFNHEIPLEDVIADAERMLQTWQVQVTHPRYLGLFNPSVTLASVVADTLVALYNSQLANWRTSPAANEIERHTLSWFAAKFGLPPETIATFTSGGTEANLSAVTVALTRAFPEYGEHGLRHLDRTPTLYLTDEAHFSFNKIAHMTGLGRGAIRPIRTGPDLRMDLHHLRQRVHEDRAAGFSPFMVVATGGTTAAGVIDPLLEVGQFCREEGLWFHADAAWGGSAILSPTLSKHLAGIELADSITCDAHKWLSVSMGCGVFFCRHPETVAQAFRADVNYMSGKQAGPVFDPYTNSAQWSRRFIGLKLFMTLAQLGETGYASMLEGQARMGDLLRHTLSASGWKIVNATPFPLVCFTQDGLDVPRFIAALHSEQIAWVSEARIAGAPVVRACITSFKTTEADIFWIVDKMNALVRDNPNLIHSEPLAKSREFVGQTKG